MTGKGAIYSKIFWKAGLAWGQGDVEKAIALLQGGLKRAVTSGDTEIAQVLQADLERYRRLAQDQAGDTSRDAYSAALPSVAADGKGVAKSTSV